MPDPDIEIIDSRKPRPSGNGPLIVLLAVAAVWAVAFVMGLRLRHPLPRAVLALLATGLSIVIYRANKEG